MPSMPSNNTKKGDKWGRFWIQDSRYFFFLSFSSVWRHCYGVLFWYEKASVFMTRISWILSVPLFQRSRMIISLLLRVICSNWWIVGGWYLWLLIFLSCTETPLWMRGYPHTCEGVDSFPGSSATPSRILLWRFMMRPPLLQSRELQIQKNCVSCVAVRWSSRGSMV